MTCCRLPMLLTLLLFSSSVAVAAPPGGAPGLPARVGVDVEAVLPLTHDRDAVVRLQAVRTLRGAMLDDALIARFTDLARDDAQPLRLRVEAIKALYQAPLEVHQRVLMPLAASADDAKVRDWALKSLYWSASHYPEVRSWLSARLLDRHQPAAVREAAAWALFASAWDADANAVLLRILKDEHAELPLRREALKSLYAATSVPDVLDAVTTLAEDERAPATLRETAVLVLQGANGANAVRDLLKELAKDPKVPAKIRAAALEAQQPFIDEVRIRYFHLLRVEDRLVDPLESEGVE
jgi:hypothetical protein